MKRQSASARGPIDVKTDSAPYSDGRPTMRLRVRAPFKTYYDDDIYSVSAVNDTGPFDILPHHHNFISILRSGELHIDGAHVGQQKVIINGGLMKVEADNVTVFLDV